MTAVKPTAWRRRKSDLKKARAGGALGRRIAAANTFGIGRVLLQLYGRCFDAYHRYRAHWRNAPARRAYRAHAGPLDAAQRTLVDQLRGAGLAKTMLSALLPDVDWTKLQAAANGWLATPEVRESERAYRAAMEGNGEHGSKDYLISLLGVRDEAVLEVDSPWLSVFLHERLLAVVNGYLGVFSKLNAVDVWSTVPLVHDHDDSGSQRWHRDPDDRRLVKVFLYLNEVGPGSGALEYVAHSRPDDRYGRLWPQEFPIGSRPPRDELERLIDPRDRIECSGPAGTLLFVDTCGFHRGGRATTGRRVLATSTHVTPASIWPRRFQLSGDIESVAGTEAQRRAVTLP